MNRDLEFIPVPGNDNRFVRADGSGDGVYRRTLWGHGVYVKCEESIDEGGYRRASFWWRGVYNTWPIHWAIFAAFYGMYAKGNYVHHRNLNKLDCRISNLQLRSSRDHNVLDHNKPALMKAGRGPWKPRYRDPRTGRFSGGELPPEGTQ